jgi:ribosome-binding protein aMBF1 (putative translation factor)
MNLTSLRQQRGLTQEQLAHELGLKSKSSVHEIEASNHASPSVALKIEAWSGGQIAADKLNPVVAMLRGQ